MRAGEILDDKYALERVLGQGGMGVVWAARDRTNGSRVAIKMLLEDGTSGNTPAHEKLRKELRQRLRREAEACMKLAHHPNVVRVFDVSTKDTEQHGPYIVMELLEGASLQEHLKRKRSLEPKVAARIAADVASCLTAAHAAKLVHRDLKPGNIYLHREPGMDEDEFVTKVLDFGVCKDGDSVEIASDHTPTMTGMILGSIAYMSPQQAMGSKNVDFRTDIWSVGVVLYEMLTGLRAFSGGVNEIIALYTPILIGKSTTPPVPAPSSRVRNIPPALDAVVERCTMPKPTDRYASAEELARDLYAIAGMPMPVVPSAKPSASRPSPVGSRELIDLYDSAIIGSKAVPAADEKRRFNEGARTIPLTRAFDPQAAAPAIVEKEVPLAKPPAATDVLMVGGQNNVPDTSDTDATLRMPPKGALALLPRPPVLNEPPAGGAGRTQYLRPDAPIPSPLLDLNEMHQALAEHRKSSTSIPIPDLADLEASGGTQMLNPADVPAPKRSEPSATTSVAMSQSMAQVPPQNVPFDAGGTTARRRRRDRGMLIAIGGAVAVALVLVVVVAVKQLGAKPPEPAATAPSAALPLKPVAIATEEKPPTVPAVVTGTPDAKPPTEEVTTPSPTSTTPPPKPTSPPTVKTSPTLIKAPPKPPTKDPKCTPTVFKRCPK